MLPDGYLDHEFWDVPARAANGDEDHSEIFRAVGRALTQWEYFEVELAELFTTLVETKSTAAFRVYGCIASASGRRDALKEAATVYFGNRGQELPQEFKDLMKVTAWATARRNDIAHGMAVDYANIDFPGGGAFLAPSDYNSRRMDAFVKLDEGGDDPFSFTRHKYAYASVQILEFADRFERLAHATFNYNRALKRAASEPQEAPPALP